jgi:hypothetical protein
MKWIWKKSEPPARKAARLRESDLARLSYSYTDVRNMLCDCCRAGFESHNGFTLGIVMEWQHLVNGEDVKCTASEWRAKAYRAEEKARRDGLIK